MIWSENELLWKGNVPTQITTIAELDEEHPDLPQYRVDADIHFSPWLRISRTNPDSFYYECPKNWTM